jgi:hypothetical protein
MDSINDPRNIIGMASIIGDPDDEFDPDEIEKSIIQGTSMFKKQENIDLAKEYDKELNELSRHYKISNMNKPSSFNNPSSMDDLVIDLDDQVGYQSADLDVDTGADAMDDDQPALDNTSPMGVDSSWSSSRPIDTQLGQMTIEERKQKHINSVLGNIDKVDDDANFLQAEEEEDEMAKILEQIDLLKSNLENEGIDLSRIQAVNTNTSKKEAKAVLKILQIKNDRLRYCDMFEEGILACAYALENVFDGKKVWFGSQIDLTGWSETVKVKLRRMRYDTSTFISDVVKGYSIGSGWRILFELLPSLFLYSRDRRLRSNDTLISQEKYKDALRDLNH